MLKVLLSVPPMKAFLHSPQAYIGSSSLHHPHAIIHWGQLLTGLFSDYELLLAMCWDPLLFSLLGGVHRQHIVNVCGGKRPQERMRAREPLNLSRA